MHNLNVVRVIASFRIKIKQILATFENTSDINP